MPTSTSERLWCGLPPTPPQLWSCVAKFGFAAGNSGVLTLTKWSPNFCKQSDPQHGISWSLTKGNFVVAGCCCTSTARRFPLSPSLSLHEI